MLKKSISVILIFLAIIFASNFVFATDIVNGTEGALKSVGNGVQTMVNGTKNTITNAKNGAENMMNNVGNGMQNTVNGIENGMRENNTDYGYTNTDGYTVARTATSNGMTQDTSNTITWIILAAATVAIIGLVWYYVAQTNNTNNSRH